MFHVFDIQARKESHFVPVQKFVRMSVEMREMTFYSEVNTVSDLIRFNRALRKCKTHEEIDHVVFYFI